MFTVGPVPTEILAFFSLQEIIEFPCLCLSSSSLEITSKFHSYVRPVANPMLTSFCTDLTGIIQADVEEKPVLTEVLQLFSQWIRDNVRASSKVGGRVYVTRSIGKLEFVHFSPWNDRMRMIHSEIA